MCGGGAPKPVKRDLEAENRDAERKATEKSNAELAYRRGSRRKSSLIANSGGASGLSAIQQQGKQTLG